MEANMNVIQDDMEEKLPINFRKIKGTILYRSSGLYRQHVDTLMTMNIKTIVDLRADSTKMSQKELSEHYTSYLQDVDGKGGMKEPHLLTTHGHHHSTNEGPSNEEQFGHHIVIPFVRNKWDMVLKNPAVPWYSKLFMILLIIYDWILGTGLAKTYHINVTNRDGEGSLLANYKYLFDTIGPQLCAVLKVLSRPERVPAVVCCSLGKDRTGVLCAVIGHICGRTKQQILEDYALTQAHYDRNPHNLLLKGCDVVGLHPVFKTAPPSAMSDALDYLDKKYGSMDAYLDGIGFGKEERCNLKHNIQKDTVDL